MIVGLTGGIGCGKSTVVGFFEKAGWLAVRTDDIVRELLEGDRNVIESLRVHWGGEVFDREGCIDRRAVAKLVFADEGALRWLEALLHPLVREAWQSKVERAAEDRHKLIEIPLLFEKSLESQFDLTVCVHSPDAAVESRMKARGYTNEEVEHRRARQMPVGEKMDRADHVITNAGSLTFLEEQTNYLIARIEDQLKHTMKTNSSSDSHAE